MKFVVKLLQGGLTRQEAIASRVQGIVAIGERRPGYRFKTVKSGGFAQTQLYPNDRVLLAKLRTSLADQSKAIAMDIDEL